MPIAEKALDFALERRHANLTGFALYVTMRVDVKAVFTEAWRVEQFLLEKRPPSSISVMPRPHHTESYESAT
jgi:hypothetical protein